METTSVKHDPLKYSSDLRKSGIALNAALAIIFGLGALASFITGVVLAFIDENDLWIVSWFLIPASGIFGWIAYVGYDQIKRNREHLYEFELNEQGITETNYHSKKKSPDVTHIAFDDIERMLVGNFVRSMINPNGPNFFRFGVLVVVIHKNGEFFQRMFNANETNEWIFRFQDKEIPVYYTDYNLQPAFFDKQKYDIKFSQLQGIPWDQVEMLPRVGAESFHNSYEPWQIDEVEVQKKKDARKKSLKLELYVTGIITLYGIAMGLFILPGAPVEEDYYVLMGLDSVLFEIFPIVIPMALVFWRRYRQLYMPAVYYLVYMGAVWIGLFFVEILTGTEAHYINIADYSGYMIFVWYGALILVQSFRLFIYLINKWRNLPGF